MLGGKGISSLELQAIVKANSISKEKSVGIIFMIFEGCKTVYKIYDKYRKFMTNVLIY